MADVHCILQRVKEERQNGNLRTFASRFAAVSSVLNTMLGIRSERLVFTGRCGSPTVVQPVKRP